MGFLVGAQMGTLPGWRKLKRCEAVLILESLTFFISVIGTASTWNYMSTSARKSSSAFFSFYHSLKLYQKAGSTIWPSTKHIELYPAHTCRVNELSYHAALVRFSSSSNLKVDRDLVGEEGSLSLVERPISVS